MRDTLVIVGLALVAGVVSVFLFFRGNVPNVPLSVASNDQSPASAVAVPFTPLASGSTSTVTKRVNYLISSADGLNKLWKMVDATSPPPTVDFNTNAVIAVFAGEEPTAGYTISISKIEDSSERVVSITLAKPGNNCIVGQVVTTPYEIVTMPATTLPLTHEDQAVIATCTN